MREPVLQRTIGWTLRSAVARLAGVMLVSTLPALAESRGPVPSEAAVLVQSLHARILAGPSATAVLEAWCAELGLAAEPRVLARRVPGSRPPSPEQRRRLGVGPDEPVAYRRVRLTCGEAVLSEADNWYVPARLTHEMNAALDTTDAPFGRVVRPLAPTRRTLAVRQLAMPARPAPEDPLFAVEAVLSTGDGVPFCEVAETYLGAALGPALGHSAR